MSVRAAAVLERRTDLNIGTAVETSTGKPFTLPEEALVQTFAVMGMRGSGKSTLESVMAEEFCHVNLPWIILDPPGVGWGLRAGKDGKPAGGLRNVVVFGGPHGDLPLEKSDGAKIAEAVVDANICAVVDLKSESKSTWRKFITDFCLRLLSMNPPSPRHIFIDEAGELVPQKARFAITAACKEAVERLVRQGRNNGYGVTLFNQRVATLDKDVLTQCENLFMLRTVGKHDRKALMEWLEPKFTENDVDLKTAKERATRLVNSLASMPDGRAYFWSPNWLKSFVQVQIRDRETYHPGATRTDMRGGMKHVELMDAREFVAKMQASMSRKSVVVKSAAKEVSRPAPVDPLPTPPPADDTLKKELAHREEQLALALEQRDYALNQVSSLTIKLSRGREVLKPMYEMFKLFFEETEMTGGASASKEALRQAMAPWLPKASKVGCRRAIETLIEFGRMTQRQLATRIGVSPGTWRNYRAWLTSNSLVILAGEWPEGTIEIDQKLAGGGM